jgi:hypothetical protein
MRRFTSLSVSAFAGGGLYQECMIVVVVRVQKAK